MRNSVEAIARCMGSKNGNHTRGILGFSFETRTQFPVTKYLLLLIALPQSKAGIRSLSNAGILKCAKISSGNLLGIIPFLDKSTMSENLTTSHPCGINPNSDSTISTFSRPGKRNSTKPFSVDCTRHFLKDFDAVGVVSDEVVVGTEDCGDFALGGKWKSWKHEHFQPLTRSLVDALLPLSYSSQQEPG